MRRSMVIALSGLLAIGVAGSAQAATLEFTGTLGINFGGYSATPGTLDFLTVPGAGSAQVTDDGALHLLSLHLAGATFGPSTVSYYVGYSLDTVRFMLAENLSGSFSGISGGPPGGGTMGLSGLVKLCFFSPPCIANIPLPLTPTVGGTGFGIGGTRTAPGGGNTGSATRFSMPPGPSASRR